MPENNEITKSIANEIEAEIRAKLTNEGIDLLSSPEEQPVELTEEEQREKLIQTLKDSKKVYKPKKNFGTAYRQERKRKNRQARASRRKNR